MLSLFLSLALVQGPAPGSVDDLRDALARRVDLPDPALVLELAESRSPGALEALGELLDRAGGRTARIAFVRGLALFAEADVGVGGAQRARALERLERELLRGAEPRAGSREGEGAATLAERDRAVAHEVADALTLFGPEGRAALARVALGPGHVDVRRTALGAHGRGATAEDLDLYRQLVDGAPRVRPMELAPWMPARHPPEVRALALTLAAPYALPSDLERWANDGEVEIVLEALDELGRRGGATLVRVAEIRLRPDHADWVGLAAARQLLRANAGDWPAKLLERALDPAEEFGLGPGLVREFAAEFAREPTTLAEATAQDELLNLALKLARGRDVWPRLGAARALTDLSSHGADALFETLWEDRDARVRAAALRALARRGRAEHLALWLTALRADGLRPEELRDPARLEEQLARVEAVALLGGGTGAVTESLAQLVGVPLRPLRNAALEWLGRTSNGRRLDVLAGALRHPDWSTRLFAVRGLALSNSERAVPFLIQALDLGDARQAREAARVLEGWTGRDHGTDPRPWRLWWAGARTTWRVPRSAAHPAGGEPPVPSPSARTRAEFFGSPLGSDRVVFVIDASGSMEAALSRALSAGQQSRASAKWESRMDRAKRELADSLQGLGAGATVQVVVFDDRVRKLWPAARVLDEPRIKEALRFVGKLHAGGSTNLYGGLLAALAETELDTIVLLSDGEPSSGELVHPSVIQDEFERWNRYRGVTLHGVAMGESAVLVRQLAQGAGGSLVLVR